MTRPLQLHLSTLLIVMLLAAVLVWLNVRERKSGVRYWIGGPTHGPGAIVEESRARGWPMSYAEWFDVPPPGPNEISLDDFFFPHERLHMAAVNLVLCLAILAVAAAAIEWVTRRKPTP
jgi:hypothetical protein